MFSHTEILLELNEQKPTFKSLQFHAPFIFEEADKVNDNIIRILFSTLTAFINPLISPKSDGDNSFGSYLTTSCDSLR